MNSSTSTKERKLVELIRKKFGNNYVKESSKTPDATAYYSIKKEGFVDSFTSTKFIEYATKNWTGDYIPISCFVEYITEYANDTYTRGKYHEFMDYVIVYHEIELIGGIPEYKLINDDRLKKKLFPKREEYIAIWVILQRIREHPYLKRYQKSYLKPTYQQCVNVGDGRFYDLLFEKLGIIIEIQELSFSHTKNINDELKEAIVKVKNMNIYYFKLGEYKQNQRLYLNTAFKEIEQLLINSLLTQNVDIRKEYVFYVFEERIKKEIDDIKLFLSNPPHGTTEIVIRGKTNRMNTLDILFSRKDDRSTIKKLFEWKSKKHIENESYIITMDDIGYILRADTSSMINTLTDDVVDMGNFKEVDGSITLDWKGAMEIVMVTKMCRPADKRVLLSYFTMIEEIYEEILQATEKHYTDCLDVSVKMMEMVNTHMDTKMSDKYGSIIKKQKADIKVLEKLNKTYVCKMKMVHSKGNTLYNALTRKVTTKKETELMENWNRALVELNALFKTHEEDQLTVQHICGKSIFAEIPDFPIVYNGSHTSYVIIEDFESICLEWKIPKNKFRKSYELLGIPFTKIRPNNISCIEIRADMRQRYPSMCFQAQIVGNKIASTSLLDYIDDINEVSNVDESESDDTKYDEAYHSFVNDDEVSSSSDDNNFDTDDESDCGKAEIDDFIDEGEK